MRLTVETDLHNVNEVGRLDTPPCIGRDRGIEIIIGELLFVVRGVRGFILQGSG